MKEKAMRFKTKFNQGVVPFVKWAGYESYRRVTDTLSGGLIASSLVFSGLALVPATKDYYDDMKQHQEAVAASDAETARRWDQGSGNVPAEKAELQALTSALQDYQRTEKALAEARGVKIMMLEAEAQKKESRAHEALVRSEHLPEKTLASLAVKYLLVANTKEGFDQFAYFRERKIIGQKPYVFIPTSLEQAKPQFEFKGERAGYYFFLTMLGLPLVLTSPLWTQLRERNLPRKKINDFRPRMN
jgi:hypothetical protein